MSSTLKNNEPQKLNNKNVGVTGTEIFTGLIREDKNPILTGRSGAKVFDTMHRTDAMVSSLYRLATMPILNANWNVEAAEGHEDQAELIEQIFFNGFVDYLGGCKTWNEFITNVVTIVKYGYALFEVTYKPFIGDPKFGDYIGINNFSWRSPKTIVRWNIENGKLSSVEQQAFGDLVDDKFRSVDIPIDNLFLISWGREGDNYEGISWFRAIHKNYQYKLSNEEAKQVGIQRASLGFAVGTYDKSAQNDDAVREAFQEALMSIRNSSTGSVMKPEGFDIEMLQVAYDHDGVLKSIQHENSEMMKAFMANILDLGTSGNSGSRALSDDLSDIFFSSIQAIPQMLVDELNTTIVKKLIDVNFGVQEEYPKITFSNINDRASKDRAEIIKLLADSQAIDMNKEVVKAVHSEFNLPEPSDDFEPEGAVKDDDNNLDSINSSDNNSDTALDTLDDEIEFAEKGEGSSSDPVVRLIRKNTKIINGLDQKHIAIIGEKTIDQLVPSIKKNPASAFTSMEQQGLIGTRDYKKDLDVAVANELQEATNQTLKELNQQQLQFSEIDDVDSPNSSKRKAKETKKIHERAVLNGLEQSILISIGTAGITDNADDIIARMRQSAEDFISNNAIATGGDNLSIAVVNDARDALFLDKTIAKLIESFVYVNASPVADICVNLAGRVISYEEYLTTLNLPPFHHRCKTFMSPQLTGNKKNKPISDTGSSLVGTENQIATMRKSASFVY